MASATSPAVVAALSDLSSALDDTFDVVRGPIRGWYNHVYEIKSSKKDRFILRIPKEAGFVRYANQGLKELKRIQELRPTTKLPTVVRQTDKYNVVSYIPGQTLHAWDTEKMSGAHRRAILDDLAEVMYATWTVSLRSVKGTYEPMDYEKWLLKEIDRGLIRSLEGSCGWGDPIHYLYRRAMMENVLPEIEHGYASVNYGFMQSLDVVVQGNRLSGVVDWDDARLVPGPAAIHPPLFIAGIPGWKTGAPEGVDFWGDREYFIEAITNIDVFGGLITDLLTSSYDRQFLEMSLHNKLINDEYVRRRLQTAPKAFNVAALEQLDDFVSSHESMRGARSVAKLRERLNKLIA